MVRAKFVLYSKEEVASTTNTYNLVFNAVTAHGGDTEEFWKYTPSGQLQMQCVNADAAAKFEVGKQYYLDFTPVPVPASED